MLRVFIEEGNTWDLLKRAAGQVWGFAELPEISCQPGGKPFFVSHPECHFSLSHSGELALCALSDKPVGADLELIRPRRAGFPAYVFRGAAYERYLALGGDWGAFYALWTELESIVKYTGEGLRAWRRAEVPAECVISPLSGDGWRGAVCAQEPLTVEYEK